MSRFTAYRNNLPPGVTDADGGASHIYQCDDCDTECSQEELSDAVEDAILCEECALRRFNNSYDV